MGSRLDGYTVTALVADTGVHRIFQARAHGGVNECGQASGGLVALKMLHESRAGDADERAMLAHEGWLGARLTQGQAARDTSRAASGFVRVHEPVKPSAFYLVFDWHGGRTLAQRLAKGERGSVNEIVSAAIAIAHALGQMHRAGVVHRDIKPANLHLGDDGTWRILDLGVAVSGREPKAQRSLHAGTPSYMNPEQWDNPPRPPDAGSDLYALGASLYQWLTGKLPYGEIEPFQRGRFRRDPRPPSRMAPDVPVWLSHVVAKAVALDSRQRFETAEELVLALERGAARALPAPHATPLAQRDPALLWQVGFGLSVLLNALLVIWLLFLPR